MEYNSEIDKGLSEFINTVSIRRTDDIAEIIVEYFENDINKPIRLIGFCTKSSKTDFEIYEEGYEYYNNLKQELGFTI